MGDGPGNLTQSDLIRAKLCGETRAMSGRRGSNALPNLAENGDVHDNNDNDNNHSDDCD